MCAYPRCAHASGVCAPAVCVLGVRDPGCVIQVCVIRLCACSRCACPRCVHGLAHSGGAETGGRARGGAAQCPGHFTRRKTGAWGADRWGFPGRAGGAGTRARGAHLALTCRPTPRMPADEDGAASAQHLHHPLPAVDHGHRAHLPRGDARGAVGGGEAAPLCSGHLAPQHPCARAAVAGPGRGWEASSGLPLGLGVGGAPGHGGASPERPAGRSGRPPSRPWPTGSRGRRRR